MVVAYTCVGGMVGVYAWVGGIVGGCAVWISVCRGEEACTCLAALIITGIMIISTEIIMIANTERIIISTVTIIISVPGHR